MILAFALVAAAQPADAPAPASPVARVARSLQCDMRTPAGDVLRFRLEPVDGWDGPARVVGVDGWRTGEGARAVPRRTVGPEVEFAVEGLSRPVALRVDQTSVAKNATIFAPNGEEVGVPLAFGFCVTYALDPLPPPASAPPAGDPFDPSRWNGDCHFVSAAPGSVRTSFGWSFRSEAGRPALRLQPRDRTIWNEAVSGSLESIPPGQIAGIMIDPQRFAGAAGSNLRGMMVTYIDAGSGTASTVVRFNQYSATNQPGYAICRAAVTVVPGTPAR
jgi:hypothetical protein